MNYLLAALPILVLLGLMVGPRWSGQRAAPMAWLACAVIAVSAFGLNLPVLWVSQAKALLLGLFVLYILAPALLLYHVVNLTGGIQALAGWLRVSVADRELLLIVLAWSFSGALEGLAGFGLPIAITAPMLVALGASPLNAVIAAAVGHGWAVTFGDMGIIFQTLVGVSGIDGSQLVLPAALLEGLAVLGCGLGAAAALGLIRRWPAVLGLSVVVGGTQALLALAGLTPLGALGAGLAGMLAGALFGRQPRAGQPLDADLPAPSGLGLRTALYSYGAVAGLMGLIGLVPPIARALETVVWAAAFPAVTAGNGFLNPSGTGQVFRPLVHPGTVILLVTGAAYLLLRARGALRPGSGRIALNATAQTVLPASLGILSTIGLSTLMEHTGMTLVLAQGASAALGSAYPVFSPLIGILGTFATSSANNSNVLFATLQRDAASLLGLEPRFLVASQTTGASLGSMVSPAKIIVGCSTVGLVGRDGDVLRRTAVYAVVIGLGIGLILWGALLFG